MTTIAEEIIALVERLSPADQRRALEFMKGLAEGHAVPASSSGSPLAKGKPGKVPPDAKPPLLVVEEQAVEESEQTPPDSEQIDVDEW